MKTIFNTDLHLDRIIHFNGHSVRVYPHVSFTDYVCQATSNSNTDKVSELYTHLGNESCGNQEYPASSLPQLHIDTVITFILLLDILELELKSCILTQLAWSSEFLR